MPVNYAQVTNSLDRFADQYRQKEEERQQASEALQELLSRAADNQAAVTDAIERAEQQLSTLYTAKPTGEPVLAAFPLPAAPTEYLLIAADGSQIVPNRHRALQFSLVNIGLIKAHIGSGREPEIDILSRMLDQEELYTSEGGLIGDDEVALYRDLAEREFLLDAAPVESDIPVITLTDGPLDVFYRSTLQGQRRQVIQQRVQTIDRQMQARGVLSAGYIDKPGSEMLSRMLDLYDKTRSGSAAGYEPKNRSYKGVSDAALLRSHLHAPGARSAMFEVITKSESSKGNTLEVCFFLLNVGSTPEAPCLARVEFPRWLAADPAKVDLLHAVLYADAQVLDTHPYPYLLQRSHELAVVNMAEHDEVENILLQKLDHEQLSTGMNSNKQFNKGLLKR